MAWGRLALIHAAGESAETLEKMAQLWGYERELINFIAERGSTLDIELTTSPKEDNKTTDTPKRPPALFIVVSKLQTLPTTNPNEPDYINKPDYTLKPDTTGSYCFPAAKPLLSMARLIPLLHNGLGQTRTGNNIDIARLSSQLAQGKALKRLPYLSRQVWSQRVQIIVDARLDLEPYWLDFIFIINELKKLLGQEAVTSIRFDEDTVTQDLAYCLSYPATSVASWQVWQVPANDVAVLILSDLKARHWKPLLKRLQRHTAPILTLSPSASTPTTLSICQLAKPNPLNDTQPLPRHPYQKGFKLPELSDTKRLEIFALLSVLPLIDTALLRRLRKELKWGSSELEHFIWQHSEIRYNGLGIYIPKDIAESYRPYYPHGKTETFWRIVHEHHEGAFQGLKCFEGLNHYAMEQHTELDIKDYYQRLTTTLNYTPEHAENYIALQAQAKTVITLMPNRILETELNNTVHHLAAFAYADDIRVENWQPLLDQGLDIEKVRWIIPKEQQPLRQWHIVQVGQGQFHCIQTDILPKLSIAKLSAILPPVQIMSDGKQQLLEHQVITLAENDTVTIKTASQYLELKIIQKPDWATRIWRDTQGLFVSTEWMDKMYEARWQVAEESYWAWSKPIRFTEYLKMQVVIITALPLEYRAVKNFLTNCRELLHPSGTIYEEGEYQHWKIGLAEIGQGDSKAAVEIGKAIQFFNPAYVFFVGVAGGIKDVNLGDVVIAELVKGYEKGKGTDAGFLPRGEVVQSNFALIQRAKAIAKNDWFKNLKTEPNALVGVIAAGEKVVASEHGTTYERLTKLYSDALAVEMEGIGFLTAIHASNARGIVIRGISTLLSNKTESDNAGWQEKAAHHAAAFAFAMLDKLVNQSSETQIKSEVKAIQSLIDLMGEKLAYLENAFFLETNATVKFKLKNEITELQQQIKRKKALNLSSNTEKTLKLFYSYSHEDEALRNRLGVCRTYP